MIKCSSEAYAKCQEHCHHCQNPDEAYYLEGSDCDKFNQQINRKLMTNADRIRAMSDAELAHLLLDGCRGSECDKQPHNEYGSVNCYQCRMDWLKQPAEGDVNNA